MIKIIKQGQKPKKTKTIWTFICPECGCEFECELDDFVRSEKTIDGDKVVLCPCCSKELHTNKDKYTTREEEIIEPTPIVVPFNPNPDYDPWRYPGYPDPRDEWLHKYTPPKDPCETCPNRLGPRDGLGNPIVGDSPCQWCPHYKWKITFANKN